MATDGGSKMLLVVAAALIDDEGRVLLAQRPEGKHLAGTWEFPGGKVDAGEAPESALLRELKEELDVDVELEDVHPLTFASHTYDKFHLLMPVWAVRKWRGEVRGAEGQNVAWVAESDLGSYEMPPADLPLVAPIVAAMRQAAART